MKKVFSCFLSIFICFLSLVAPSAYAFDEADIPSVPDGYDVFWFNEQSFLAYFESYVNESLVKEGKTFDDFKYYSYGYSFLSSRKNSVIFYGVLYSSLPVFSVSESGDRIINIDIGCSSKVFSFAIDSFNDSYGCHFNGALGTTDIYSIDDVSKEVILNNRSYSNSRWYNRTNLPENCFSDIGLNFQDNTFFESGTSSSGSVKVSFNPEFDIDMNKKAYQNGPVKFEDLPSTFFSMNIDNGLSVPIQIRMYITGKGEKFSLGEVSAGPTHTGFQNQNWNVDFIYMTKDWVIAPDISNGDTSKDRVQYKPTSWHAVSASGSFYQNFAWSQVNVVENQEYDLVVEYVEMSDAAYADVSVSDSNIKECYRQTFSLYKRPIAYNPESEGEFGVLGIHGYDDYLTAENSAEGYIDDNGKTQIKETLNVNPYLQGSGTGSQQLYSGGSFSLSSLQSSTASVLGFFKYALSFFPSQIWNGFYFLFVVAVVLGFVKLLKG